MSTEEALPWEILIGAAITLVVAGLTEWNARRRAREEREREDQTRFHAERLSSYAAFLSGLRRNVGLLRGVHKRHRLNQEVPVSELDTIITAARELEAAVDRIALLGSRKVVRLAEGVLTHIRNGAPELKRDRSEEAWEKFHAAYVEKRRALRTALREDLGVPSKGLDDADEGGEPLVSLRVTERYSADSDDSK